MPMDATAHAFLLVYELTAFLYSAVFAAVLLVYALLTLYLERIYKQTREDFERLKKEAESNLPQGEGILPVRAENWKMQIVVSKRKLETWERPFKSHTVESALLKPAGLSLAGIAVLFLAILILYLNWSFWGLWFSLAVYLASGFLVYQGLTRHLVPRLKQVEDSAKEPGESPVAALQRILKEQAEQRLQEQQETNVRLLAVLERAVRGLERQYALKVPEFKVLFTNDGKRGDRLEVCLGMEKEIRLAVVNRSPFAIEQGLLEVVVPNRVKVSKEGSFERRLSYEYTDALPSGTALLRKLGAFPPSYVVELAFMIETFQAGKFHLKVHLNSTSHERYAAVLELVAK